MKFFILFLLLLNILYAKNSLVNEFKTGYNGIDINSLKYNELYTNTWLNSLETLYKYENDDIELIANTYAYYTANDDNIANISVGDTYTVHNKDIFFKVLYLGYYLDNYTIGAGLISIGDGTPIQYTKDFISGGEGLSILSNGDAYSIFIKYENEDNNWFLGYIRPQISKEFTIGSCHDSPYSWGTWGISLIYKKNIDKFHFESEITFGDIKYEYQHYSYMNMFGYAIVYDDSLNSGWVLYNSAGYSRMNYNGLKDPILDDLDISNEDMEEHPESFNFTPGIYEGYANLIGIKYEYDLFGYEQSILGEWFHTWGDWNSMNLTKYYDSNSNYLTNTKNNSLFFKYTIKFNNISWSIDYTYIEFKETKAIGAPTYIPTENSLGAQIENTRILKTNISIIF